MGIKNANKFASLYASIISNIHTLTHTHTQKSGPNDLLALCTCVGDTFRACCSCWLCNDFCVLYLAWLQSFLLLL